jgi:Arc/MetJ-type ribon-helix-helix transcriptional regulator
MKTTLDIPAKELAQAVKYTHAKSRAEAVRVALRELNQRRRLANVAARLKGALPGFMSQADLKVLREDAKWESAG